jgi:tRNA A-37 threonylcarbamoyl transferase component Bud32
VHPQLVPDSIRPLLEHPEEHLAAASFVYQDTELTTLGRVGPFEPHGPRLVLRRLNYGRLSHRLRDWFRPSRARRAFRWGLELEAVAVRTPRVLAAGERRCWRLPLRSFLVTEEVAGARTLVAYLEQIGTMPAGFIDSLAEIIGRLHQAGFSHRDLKGSNILVDGEDQPWVIDLDGVRRFRSIGPHRADRDLRPLVRSLRQHPGLSPQIERRFLDTYCQARDWVGGQEQLASAMMRG